jgi:import receptor subunit TOM20
MSVVATKEIKAGEELHVGFIDQKNGTLSTEQRRQELFQRYRFKCMCPLCEATDKAAEKAAEEATKEAAEETAEEATKEVTDEPTIEVGKAADEV